MDKLITDRLKITKGLLALLIISINIREPLFHTRELLYALLIVTSAVFGYMRIKNAKYAVALVAIWCVSTLYNLVVRGSNIKLNEGGFDAIIVSGYLLLMCFCQKQFARTIESAYLFVSIVVALVTISIWTACFFSESVFLKLAAYFSDLYHRTGLSFIGVGRRAILGITLLTVWYRTAPCMVCALGYCLIERLKGRKKQTLKIILLSVALVMSGTRANILASILLLAFYFAYALRKKGFKIITIVLLAVAMIVAFVYVGKFLTDRNSYSSAVKMSDAQTYMDIFKSDPIRTMMFGWGCGSSFFSKERGLIINVSELSLFETIRRYGLIATCIIMFWIWLSPFKGRHFIAQSKYKILYISTLLAYIMVAFTNPYLIDSVGFCALLFFNTWFRYGSLTEEVSEEDLLIEK